MARYVITAPDGFEYEVDAPDGASEAQVMSYAVANYKAAPANAAPDPSAPTTAPAPMARQPQDVADLRPGTNATVDRLLAEGHESTGRNPLLAGSPAGVIANVAQGAIGRLLGLDPNQETIREHAPELETSPLADTLMDVATNQAPNLLKSNLQRGAHLVGGAADFASDWGRILEENVPIGGFIEDEESFLGARYAGPDEYRERVTPESEILEQFAQRAGGVDLGYVPNKTPEDVKRAYREGRYGDMLTEGVSLGGQMFAETALSDMPAAMMRPWAYGGARSGEIGQERAEIMGREQPNAADMTIATGAGATSALLERLGALNVFGGKQVGETFVKAVGRGGAVEGATEFLQELTEYIGANAGSDDFSWAEGLERGAWGALGGGVGGTGASTLRAGADELGRNLNPINDIEVLAMQMEGLDAQRQEAFDAGDTKLVAKLEKEIKGVIKNGRALLGVAKGRDINLEDPTGVADIPEGHVPLANVFPMEDNPELESTAPPASVSAPLEAATQAPSAGDSNPQPAPLPTVEQPPEETPEPVAASAVDYGRLEGWMDELREITGRSPEKDAFTERMGFPEGLPKVRIMATLQKVQDVLDEVDDTTYATISNPETSREEQVRQLATAVEIRYDQEGRDDIGMDLGIIPTGIHNKSATPEMIAERIVELFHREQTDGQEENQQETIPGTQEAPVSDDSEGEAAEETGADQEGAPNDDGSGRQLPGDGPSGEGTDSATEGRAETEGVDEQENKNLRGTNLNPKGGVPFKTEAMAETARKKYDEPNEWHVIPVVQKGVKGFGLAPNEDTEVAPEMALARERLVAEYPDETEWIADADYFIENATEEQVAKFIEAALSAKPDAPSSWHLVAMDIWKKGNAPERLSAGANSLARYLPGQFTEEAEDSGQNERVAEHVINTLEDQGITNAVQGPVSEQFNDLYYSHPEVFRQYVTDIVAAFSPEESAVALVDALDKDGLSSDLRGVSMESMAESLGAPHPTGDAIVEEVYNYISGAGLIRDEANPVAGLLAELDKMEAELEAEIDAEKAKPKPTLLSTSDISGGGRPNLPKKVDGRTEVTGIADGVTAVITKTGDGEYSVEFSDELTGSFGKGPGTGQEGPKAKWYDREYAEVPSSSASEKTTGAMIHALHTNAKWRVEQEAESASQRKKFTESRDREYAEAEAKLQGEKDQRAKAKAEDDAHRKMMAEGKAKAKKEAKAERAAKRATRTSDNPKTKELIEAVDGDKKAAVEALAAAVGPELEDYLEALATPGPDYRHHKVSERAFRDELEELDSTTLAEIGELLDTYDDAFMIMDELFQVIQETGIAYDPYADSAYDTNLDDSSLSSKTPGHTGGEPGASTLRRPTPSTEPLETVARKRQERRQNQRKRREPVELAPQRENVSTSPYDKMFLDLAGGDETKAALLATMGIDEQLAWAKRIVKSRYGFKEINVGPKISGREAMDILMDAYQNLRNMAAVIGIRDEAVGFEGNMILTLDKQIAGAGKGTRGMFSWNYREGFDASVLSLARRADSFAHEWGHALDLYLQMYQAMIRQPDGSYKYNTKALRHRNFKGNPSAQHAIGASGQSNKGLNPRREAGEKIDHAVKNIMRALFFNEDPEPILEMMGKARNLTAKNEVDQRELNEVSRRLDTRRGWLAKTEASLDRYTRLLADAEDKLGRTQVGSANREKFASSAEYNRSRAHDMREKAKEQRAEVNTLRKRKGELEASIKENATEIVKLNAEAGKMTKKIRSAFSESARYADFLSDADYFAIPSEMLARSFEAYIADRVGEAQGVEFLAGSKAHYNSASDSGREMADMSQSEMMMSLIYPAEIDRIRINAGFDALFEVLGDAKVFGTPHRGREVVTADTESRLDKEIKERLDAKGVEGNIVRMRNAINGDLSAIRDGVAAARKGLATLPSGTRKAVTNFRDADVNEASNLLSWAVSRTPFATARGKLLGLQSKYGNKPGVKRELRKIMLKIATDPGSGDWQGRTLEEDADLMFKEAMNRQARILKAFDIDTTDEKQMGLLREMLVRPYEGQVTEALERMTEAEENLEEVKRQVGEDPKGNLLAKLQRAIAHHAAVKEHLTTTQRTLKGFHKRVEGADPGLAQAAKGIRQIMDKQWYLADKAGVNYGYTRNGYLPRMIDNDAIENDRAGFLKAAEKTYSSQQVSAAFQARKKMRAIKEELDRKPNKRRVVQLHKEFAEADAELKKWQTFSPAEAAQEWLYALTVNEFYTQDKSGPPQTFAKHRTLPPEADIIMQEFYEKDPTIATMSYLQASSRRIAFAKRFGADSSILKDHRDRLVELGMDPNDLESVDTAIKVAIGAYRPTVSGIGSVANWFFHMGNAILLVNTLFAQIAEPLTVGIRTGNTMDGLAAMAGVIADLANSPDARTRREMMEVLGITGDILSDQIMHNKMMMSGTDSKQATAMMTNFFKATGVFAYTQASRRASAALGQKYMVSWAERYLDPDSPEQRDAASRTLSELGIPPREQAAFSEWLIQLGDNPKGSQLENPHEAKLVTHYATAINRFIDQTIQNPRAVDRPIGAFNPVGRFVFSLTSFAYTFQRNVLIRHMKMLKRDVERGDWEDAGMHTLQYVPAFAMLMAGQMAMQITRDAWVDWGVGDEDDKETRVEKRVATWTADPMKAFFDGFSRSGGFGGFDATYQAATGFKYNRSLQESLVGAIPGFYAGAVTDIVKGMIDGHESNRAEWKAWKAGYQLLMGSTMAVATSRFSASGPLAWLGFTKLNSVGAQETFANFMAGGPPGTKTESGEVVESGGGGGGGRRGGGASGGRR